MDWSNEKALEFLELLQREPCLWNPKVPSHKNRTANSSAWRRIIQALSFPVNIEELKKKKDSLMGYYRIHLNKYKKSLKSGAGPDDVYKTNWFAFEAMDSFLRPIYGIKEIKTESPEEDSSDETMTETAEEVYELTPRPASSREYELTPVPAINRQNIETFKRPHAQNQKSYTPEDIYAQKQTDDTIEQLQSTNQKTEKMDEYDHFAFMIAAKIRKLQNPDDREILMNSIQNLTFEFYMKNRQNIIPERSATQPLVRS